MRGFVLIAALLVSAPAIAQGSNSVKGYVRSDGTYVAPHYRTNPDSRTTNNWSSQGNFNPYTGEAGRVDPYAPKLPSSSSAYKPYQPYKPYKPKY